MSGATRLDVTGSESGERYRRLVELSPDGIFISEDTRIVFLNPAAVRLFGASSPEQVLGTPVFALFDAGSHPLIRERIAKLLAGESAPFVHEKIVRLDGAVTDVEVAATLLEEGGSAIQVIVRDLTERKRAQAALRESEERLTLAFAGAQEGVWDWNLETGAVVYSPRWKEMLGYVDDEIEPHVSAWERLLHPDDTARASELLDAVSRGERNYEMEFRLRHRDGHYVDILSRGYPVRRGGPTGPVVRIVGTHLDLTERKRASRTDLLSRLVFAQEDERRRIAREMHDQFGEQLTALDRHVELLKQACKGRPELTAQVEALDAVARQLDRDVEHLVWQLRPTALDDLGLRAALANYVQDWSARVGIPAELHTFGLLDERLAAEAETTLFRIAQEALTNIAKHARATHVEVILERRADQVVLIVEDDGVGFDPAQRAAGASGFGLLGMEERAALVGASLQIESAVGEGATIFLRMTAAPADAPRADYV